MTATDADSKRSAAQRWAPNAVLVVAFLVTVLIVLGIGRALLEQRSGTASAAEAWAAADGSEARIAVLVAEQGCDQALVHLRRRAAGVDTAAVELNAFGVCLARTGDFTGARRAFDLALRRGAGEHSPAHTNREALDAFLIARQYVDALELTPLPEPPVLPLREDREGG